MFSLLFGTMNQDQNSHPPAEMTAAEAPGETSGNKIAATATNNNANSNSASSQDLPSSANNDAAVLPVAARAAEIAQQASPLEAEQLSKKPWKLTRPLGMPISPHFKSIAQTLASTVDFFREHTDLKDLDHMYYTEIPPNSNIDWSKASSIAVAFPILKGRGKLVLPMALVLEAESLDGKLVAINYWRLLRADEQRKVREAMRSFYLRPSMSNERIHLNVAKRVMQAKDSSAQQAQEKTTGGATITAKDPEGIQGLSIAENQAFAQARDNLASRVRFFKDVAPLDDLSTLHFHSVPPGIDWNDATSVHSLFPPLATNTQKEVPMCMILQCQTDEERLIVVNWFRYLDSLQLSHVVQELLRFYRAPMKSKELMPGFRVIRDKRKERDLAPTWGFRCIETSQQLAEKLQLSTDMIQTANIELGAICSKEDCIYPAISNNGGFCCLHRSAFAPMAGKERRKRGYMLLGAPYTRPTDKMCSCQSETCVGIGFSSAMVRFDVTRLSEELQGDIWEGIMPRSRKSAVLAPWHFHPQHRVFLPDGSWKIVEYRKSTVFKDPVSAKEWPGVPPPTYSPKDFLQEQEMLEYKKRKETSLLPPWVRQYQLLEEGPLSIPEQQTNQLYNRITHLEEKLNAQALHFETKFHAMEKEIGELREKCGDKKGGKRKRKRPAADTNGAKAKRGSGEAPNGENGNEAEDPSNFQNGGGVLQAQGNVGADQEHTQYDHPATFAPYYQERARYTGAWPSGGGATRRYY